ncbi:Zn(II)2Cys6 transcription factor [Penicillium digitatum]|uniref:Uncharacterized protein n=3 Tax=Penicillium digitatum TaxID=36651 RepID=K9FDK8_PEND2|nr:hypothetical protein PDIP_43850 [Penicillium digitatum Pd1]EKV07299.1 hypothetical protein PDIG_73370 [Penicillium digitatum PHI26]EKV14399.1 hypothetical protein PDIP_43850 [Penicillium digitatum Pd1]KAG0159847.1 hypothetical protein PDIDSM_7374 [Penicillium digitatum]QQK46048.1 Zn(II)2Cys6 transcription factor [Penicillium digitatum]
MVVFVDLDDSFSDGSAFLEKPFPVVDPIASEPAELPTSPISPNETTEEIQNPNRNGFSAALSCYPIVKEIARAIDLNTLYALSNSCRQFHANLAPFRHQLARETLRCENEYIETLAEMLHSGSVLPDSIKSVIRLLSRSSGEHGRMTRGKVGKCARDMVGECRRCAKVVCRNCTIKPPSQPALKNRIRRLCRPCRTAPLSSHLTYITSDPHNPDSWDENSVAAIAFARNPCNCEEAVWLCTHCGMTLRSNDTTYRRVWTWRTRYSTYLGGGLGTGIGESCQGVKCGRGENCLAAQEIELEVDCEADEGSGSGGDTSTVQSPAAPPLFGYEGIGISVDSYDDDEEPGYFRQEVIGLGGVVKQKSKKRVNVGACVVEYEDERETGNYLEREEKGLHRAWCGWCSRVIPAKSEQT